MKFRDLLKKTVLGAGGVSMQARAARPAASKTYLLVHGAWHNAFHWTRVAQNLSGKGHRVVAIDLPGHGLNARFPSAYVAGDWARLVDEVSPQKDIRLDDCASAVAEALRVLTDEVRPILVGHSTGGTVITRAGELAPELIGRLVYLSGYVPLGLEKESTYADLPEARTGYGEDLVIGDPAKIGAVRINPRGDAAYLEDLRTAYYNDVQPIDFLPFALSLTPDLPLALATSAVDATRDRWGRIPRTFIRCTKDRAIAPALQDLMIREADAFTPDNRFDQKALAASHAAFASRPKELTEILNELG